MSDTAIQAASPATPAENGDGKKSGNMTGAQATQQLLDRYMPKAEVAKPEEPKPEPASVAPAEEAQIEAAPSSEAEPPAPEVAAEPEAPKAEGETEAPQGEDVLSHDTTLTPEEREKFKAVTAQWQEGVNKRIGKEKQKRLDAEAKAQALEARLAVPPVTPEPVIITAPTPDNPLADVGDFPSLAKRQQEANSAINEAQVWLDKLEDSGQSEVQMGDTVYTKAALREIRRNAERTLREHIPARQNFLVQQQQALRGVMTDFPELADRNSKAHQELLQVKARYPMLAHLPDSDYWIGLAMEGARSLAAKKAAKGAPAKPVQPAPSKTPPAAQVAASAAVNATSRGRMNPQAALAAEEKRVFGGKNVTAAQATALLLKRELSNLR